MSKVFRKQAYPIPVSQVTVVADFQQFSIGVLRDPPGQLWADFVHDTDEFVVVVEGMIEIDVAGEESQCGPGDLVLIPSRCLHTLHTSPAAGSVWYYGFGSFGG